MARAIGSGAALLPVVLLLLAGPLVAAQSIFSPHGAYLGCFNLTLLEGVRGEPAKLAPYSAYKCAPFCRSQGHALNAIASGFACRCLSVVPSESARAPDVACAEGGAGVALFYNHRRVDDNACRLANVPVDKSSFSFHYNDYHAAFDGGVLTTKMEGTNGLRFTTSDGMHKYGLFQVTGKIDKSSGAVTAFYTRSSDEYNTANQGDFDEIDFEFLNGNPSVPSGLWLNSFHHGLSGGERLVKPEEYRKLLGLADGQDASNTFLTFSFDWQPDHVNWYANGVALLRRHYGQLISWKDMKGVTYRRNYRPPSVASHVTFSMWADQDQTRAFGGKLEWDKSPFTSQFKELRRVLCDLPATEQRGPQWLYPSTAAAPDQVVDAVQRKAKAGDAQGSRAPKPAKKTHA